MLLRITKEKEKQTTNQPTLFVVAENERRMTWPRLFLKRTNRPSSKLMRLSGGKLERLLSIILSIMHAASHRDAQL